jgi:hypothetical protein
MHHPDIHDIILAVDDFLLLSDYQCNWEIFPVTREEHIQPTANQSRMRGLKLRKQLKNGWIDVNIKAEDEDSNAVTLEYLAQLSPKKRIESIRIERREFSSDKVKDVIRKILVLDKKSTH